MAPIVTYGKTKGQSVSQQQKEYLVKYMVANRAFAQGEYDRHAEGQKAYEAEWRKLGEELNYLDGPSKDEAGWQEVLQIFYLHGFYFVVFQLLIVFFL